MTKLLLKWSICQEYGHSLRECARSTPKNLGHGGGDQCFVPPPSGKSLVPPPQNIGPPPCPRIFVALRAYSLNQWPYSWQILNLSSNLVIAIAILALWKLLFDVLRPILGDFQFCSDSCVNPRHRTLVPPQIVLPPMGGYKSPPMPKSVGQTLNWVRYKQLNKPRK